MPAGLALLDWLRQLANLLGLFVSGLHLKLCELSRFLTGHKQDQALKFSCGVVCVVGLFQHQVFKFPD
jgi:hypothetical protein